MLKIVTIIAIIFCLSLATALSFSGNGSGTESDPYQITTVEQLQEMNDDLDAHYVLMNDIDASDTEEWNVKDHDNDPNTPDSATGFLPIGQYTYEQPLKSFTGSLDGQGYSIKKLYINYLIYDYAGLFNSIADGGEVSNTHLVDAKIIGDEYSGVFVGMVYVLLNEKPVRIYNCSTSGEIYGSSYVGGFCGWNNAVAGEASIINCYSDVDVYSTGIMSGGFCASNYTLHSTAFAIIENCYSTGKVNGAHYAGSFCGRNFSAKGFSFINNCFSSGDVSGDWYVGAFCGINESLGRALIRNCNSSGNAKGNYRVGGFCGRNLGQFSGKCDILYCNSSGNVEGASFTGGFCGENSCLTNKTETFIRFCYSTGEVKGFSNIGGFCGVNIADGDSSFTNIADCYSTGDVTGVANVGGFSGFLRTFNAGSETRIERCYSVGLVSCENDISGFGGIREGPGEEVIDYCYWDMETSGKELSNGGIGKNTNQMKNETTFETWDFSIVWDIDPDINEGYPILRASGPGARVHHFSGMGQGIKSDSYQITNVYELQEMKNNLSAHYILMNDIDASDTRNWNVGDHDNDPATPDIAMGFEPVGTWIEEAPKYGFTGILDGQDYTISFLYINRQSEDYVGLFGCIADGGYAYETNIDYADISGNMSVGVFVGRTYVSSADAEVTIDDCSANGKVTGNVHVGVFSGIVYVGNGTSYIRDSYAIGNVSGSAGLGGFSGMNHSVNGEANIINSYALVDVSGTTNIGGFCGINSTNDGTANIIGSYAKGGVFGSTQVGGFCGSNNGEDGRANIKDSYATGNVSGLSWIGGFCGYNSADDGIAFISCSYATGNVTSQSSGESRIGGFCVFQDTSNSATISSCYWDTQTSGTTESDGGEGKTTEEMMLKNTFENWDFDNIWCIGNRETYPQLQHFVDCDTLVSVPDVQEENYLNVYPNPTDDIINISSNEIITQIKIVDILGNIVKEVNPILDNNIQIQVGDLPAGCYVVQIMIDVRLKSYSVIIK